jgi:Basic region leucine zipper
LRLQGDYQFSEFAEFHTILDDGAAGAVPILDQTPPALSPSIATSVSPPSGFASSSSGDKGKVDSIVDSNHAHSLEGASRIAAEEDKRRRNTAASARFRVKKKQREQALERTAKEMTDKCSRLEARIGQLEMENKWLKNLITEKNENKDDIAELWRKFNRDSNSEQRTSDRLEISGTTKAEVN